MKIEIHYDTDATYAAFLISEDGKSRWQFAIVSGKSIPEMVANSTSPTRLRFERVA